MNYTLHIGPLFIDLQVQERLAATFLTTGKLISLHVNQAYIFWFEKSLGMHRGRAEDFIVAETIADIAIVGSRKSLIVKATANFTYFLFPLVCVFHQSSFCKFK